ncbi:MAG: glucose-1-phosphate adenylyltransferase, partial [Clostridiales bacterium]|nr:glucose-1-phosphate adenylyltransferase [Clostridiales bacterium]
LKRYWQPNIDLHPDHTNLDLNHLNLKIYTTKKPLPTHYTSADETVTKCLVNEGCFIEGTLENTVLFSEIKIGKKAKVSNSVLLSGVVVEEGAEINNAVIMENVVIKAGTIIGSKDSDEIYLVSSTDIVES